MAQYRVTFKALDTIECEVAADSFREAEDKFEKGVTISSWNIITQGDPMITKIEKMDEQDDSF